MVKKNPPSTCPPKHRIRQLKSYAKKRKLERRTKLSPFVGVKADILVPEPGQKCRGNPDKNVHQKKRKKKERKKARKRGICLMMGNPALLCAWCQEMAAFLSEHGMTGFELLGSIIWTGCLSRIATRRGEAAISYRE